MGQETGPHPTYEEIRWRYAQHPYIDYEYQEIYRRGELIAVAVTRREDSLVHLVDVFAPASNMSAALNALGRNLRCRRVTGVALGRMLRRCFRRAGYYTFPLGTRLLGLSSKALDVTTADWCMFMGESDIEMCHRTD